MMQEEKKTEKLYRARKGDKKKEEEKEEGDRVKKIRDERMKTSSLTDAASSSMASNVAIGPFIPLTATPSSAVREAAYETRNPAPPPPPPNEGRSGIRAPRSGTTAPRPWVLAATFSKRNPHLRANTTVLSSAVGMLE